MKFVSPLLAVKDLRAARAFYEEVLGQHVTLDLGANLSFNDGSFALQENYEGLVGVEDLKITYQSNNHEMYFEEEDFDRFIDHLNQYDIIYLHHAKEYPWGQRVVRFFDPDSHIIEVGESMESVFKRFHSQGMSVEAVADRTSHPIDFVKMYIG